MSVMLDPTAAEAESLAARQRSRAEAALQRDKRESLELAVRARWYALTVIAALLPIINPHPEVIYHELILCVFALNGWAQRRIGRVGQSRAELALIFADILLLAVALIAPNPLDPDPWPQPMLFRFENFLYFFVLLASATLAYSWRTMVTMGLGVTAVWLAGVGVASLAWQTDPSLAITPRSTAPDDLRLAEFLDPNNIRFPIRIQEVVVFMIVAATLALTVRRSNNLVLRHAVLERERANLARYFSPNVVDELSQNDDAVKHVRRQDVSVLFIDIVGFTAFAADREPEAVIKTLRSFHGRMEREVFRHGGTLDKYLGDGLMATFGTPTPSMTDALDALRCARAMCRVVDAWNLEREAAGEPVLRAGIGVHSGPVVLGDIGGRRLEFAVIGGTVNIASRLEALTRDIGVRLIASDDLIRRAQGEAQEARDQDKGAPTEALFEGFASRPDQEIRGAAEPMALWTLE